MIGNLSNDYVWISQSVRDDRRIVYISRFFQNALNGVFSHNDVERLGQRLHRIKEEWNVSLGIRKSSFD